MRESKQVEDVRPEDEPGQVDQPAGSEYHFVPPAPHHTAQALDTLPPSTHSHASSPALDEVAESVLASISELGHDDGSGKQDTAVQHSGTSASSSMPAPSSFGFASPFANAGSQISSR